MKRNVILAAAALLLGVSAVSVQPAHAIFSLGTAGGNAASYAQGNLAGQHDARRGSSGQPDLRLQSPGNINARANGWVNGFSGWHIQRYERDRERGPETPTSGRGGSLSGGYSTGVNDGD
jgi:hypothetical protein